MAFIKITEQPSLYNDLEKKPIRELLEDINEEEAEEVAAYIEDKFDVEVEVNNGMQPVYSFIIGVE